MPELYIAANRERLLEIALEITEVFSRRGENGEMRETTISFDDALLKGEQVVLNFSNEDMENREDLTDATILVEFEG